MDTHVQPAHDIMRMLPQGIESMLAPKTVAVIGATERRASVGAAVMRNLLDHEFGGRVIPVSLTHDRVFDVPAFREIGAIPGAVDLAVIVTPAATVPDVVAQCASAGVRGAIIISGGFRETGPAGAALEQRILIEARRTDMRIIGPNCIGVISPATGLYASFSSRAAAKGSVGFASQSGAICGAILDWSADANVGFSHFVSTGSMIDVGWSDIIYFLGDDAQTKSIVLYMEGIGDAAAFISAAREVALVKPVIVMKAGRTPSAAKAAVSHTGALAGSDDVIDAAFRRCGVLRVDTIEDLFSMADVLSKQPRPKGRRLAVITNAGGAGVIAVDELVRGGGQLAALSSETIANLDAALPPHWSHGNPIDVLGDAGPLRLRAALDAVAVDPGVDGLLVAFAPQAISGPSEMAEQLVPFAQCGKPILASWMGGSGVAEGTALLDAAGIPTFPYVDAATRVFDFLWRYGDSLHELYETPELPVGLPQPHLDDARLIIVRANAEGRTLLDAAESMMFLAAYGIPTLPTVAAADSNSAVRAAASIGYPVAVKLLSHTITHKTDVGGVHLDIADAAGVEQAFRAIESGVAARSAPGDFLGVTVQPMVRGEGYELILGSTIDAQFGPVVLFGLGGQLVEIFEDKALGLPPLNSTLARRLMERTKIFRALLGVRGRRPVDLDRLDELLVRFAALVIEQPRVREIDVNPLHASADGFAAVDARVVLYDASIGPEHLPKSAIRPYPSQYVGAWTNTRGQNFVIRPIRPEDEPAVRRFHTVLSDDSVYQRYAHLIGRESRMSHDRLVRTCFADYSRQMALIAMYGDDVAGIGRLVRGHIGHDAEFALLVADSYQSSGLGTEVLRRLLKIARAEGIECVFGFVLAQNSLMLKVCRRLGFSVESELRDPMVKASIRP